MSDESLALNLGAKVEGSSNSSEKNEDIEQRNIEIDTKNCDVETTIKENWWSKETTEKIDCPDPQPEEPQPEELNIESFDTDDGSETQSTYEFLAEDSPAETQSTYESASESEMEC